MVQQGKGFDDIQKNIANTAVSSNIVYRNKYKRSFIDSSSLKNAATDSKWTTGTLNFKPLEYQDPTIVGFNILFDVNGSSNIYDYDNLPNSLLLADDDPYSAYNYLLSINENERASYLQKFKSLLWSIQEVTPWYYQSITGLDKLQKIDPTKGWRPGEDSVISLEMLESIDLRVSLLRDLYRKFAWDSIYQRWMLPENMRWFSVKIIISEIRDFHLRKESIDQLPDMIDYQEDNANTLGGTVFNNERKQMIANNSTAAKVNNAITKGSDAKQRVNNLQNPDGSSIVGENEVYSDVDNTFLPMHVIYLDMCEFDFFSEGHTYMGTISRGEYDSDAANKMSFNVGRIRESSDYAIHNILLDDINIRNTSERIFSGGDKKVLMQGEHDEKILTHNVSNTNFVKDRIKALAGTLAGNAVNSLVANLFLGNAFDGNVLDKIFKKEKERATSALSKQIETLYLSSDKITSSDVKANITKTGHAYTKSIYSGEDNVELIQGEVRSSEKDIGHIKQDNHSVDDNVLTYKGRAIDENSTVITMPKNIGFDIPDAKIETLSNIGFDETPTKKDAGGNIELKEP